VRVYRRAKERHGNTPEKMLSGEGARRYGGRFNTPFTPLVYTASSRALAALEIVVNLDTEHTLPAYWIAKIIMPDALVETMAVADMPVGWDAISIHTPISARWGNLWCERGRAIAVPSVIVPEEHNILLNPRHPRFDEIAVDALKPYGLSDRLPAKRELPRDD